MTFAQPAIEPVSVSAPSPALAAAVARSGGRVLSLCEHRASFGEMLALGRPSLDGVAGMHLGDYADWAAVAHFGERPVHDGLYRRVNDDTAVIRRRDLIDAANVGTVLSCGRTDVEGLEFVGGDGVVSVYRNVAAWPRVVWTCAAEAVPPEMASRRLLEVPISRLSGPGQPGVTGAGSELLVGVRPCPESALVHVQSLDSADGRLSVRFEAPSDGVLLVSDAFYPERRAYLDGQRTATFKANVAFTAVRVPAGRHRVELRLVPTSFYVGVAVSVLAVCGWIAAVRRPSRHSR